MQPQRIAIVEAPSVLGLFPGGVSRLPDALLAAGLADRMDARNAARIEPAPYDQDRDPETLLLNAVAIADYSAELADALEPVLDAGEFPIVLGGDCSVLLGCLLSLRRREPHGLLFLDGHADFYQPEAEPNGEVASMELALATGRGPTVLSDLERLTPLVRDDDVVAFGRRDAAESEAAGSQRIEETGIRLVDLAAIRARGCAPLARESAAHLGRSDLPGFWMHLDVDVLGDDLMPAVDYRIPGGLSWSELIDTLATHIATGRALGLSVTIFNPDLDPSGDLAAELVDAIAAGIAR